MIPQVHAVGWKTYKDSNSGFSMQYPADWERFSFMGVASFTGPNDIVCGVITVENSDSSETGKIMDEIMVIDDETARVVNIC